MRPRRTRGCLVRRAALSSVVDVYAREGALKAEGQNRHVVGGVLFAAEDGFFDQCGRVVLRRFGGARGGGKHARLTDENVALVFEQTVGVKNEERSGRAVGDERAIRRSGFDAER